MSNRILLIESGKESYRAFTFEALRKSGIELALAAKAAPTWQSRYIYDFVEADVDQPRFCEIIIDYHRKQPFDGVFTFVERLVPLVADIAAELGLRAFTKESAFAARNKPEMRRRFAAAGLAVPMVAMLGETRNQAPAGFTLPAVVKPAMGFASLNVFKIDSWLQLDWVDQVIRLDNHPTLPDPGDSYLVEEYIDGPEYSVESAVSNGRMVHYGITRKVTSNEPYFEEVAHITPAPLPGHDIDAILATTDRAIMALGLDCCVTHTEIRMSERRGPVVIEVAARLGGDKIPYLVEHTTGASPSLAAGCAVLGRPLPAACAAARCAGIAFFVPREPGVTSAAVSSPPPVDGIAEFEYWTAAATKVAIPPEQFFSRLGYVLVEGGSASEVGARLERVIKHVEQVIGIPLVADIMSRLS